MSSFSSIGNKSESGRRRGSRNISKTKRIIGIFSNDSSTNQLIITSKDILQDLKLVHTFNKLKSKFY